MIRLRNSGCKFVLVSQDVYWLVVLSLFSYKISLLTYSIFSGPSVAYSISQEICTRFLLCCALLWLYNLTIAPVPATLMNMDKYFMWIHYERLHNHNKAKHTKTVCIFLGIYCISVLKVAINPCVMHICVGYRSIFHFHYNAMGARTKVRPNKLNTLPSLNTVLDFIQGKSFLPNINMILMGRPESMATHDYYIFHCILLGGLQCMLILPYHVFWSNGLPW